MKGLGDRRSQAIALRDVARLHAERGEVKLAMGFYDDVLVILEGVGERREWVITLGDKARLLQQSGETKTALELH
jgi:hypothetical protein